MNALIPSITVFCCLLLIFVCIKRLGQNTLFPTEAWILLAGIGYGLLLKNTDIHWLPDIHLEPHVVLFLFLPLLIFASGRLIDLNTLKSEALPISFFAIIGPLVTSIVIGVPIAWALDIPLLHGLLIGAAAGATDPAAVTNIFNSFKIPRRLSLILEGESLFDDGTTVVLFALIMGLLMHDSMFDLTDSLLDFIWTIFVAIPLGMLLGWLGARFLLLLGQEQVFFNVSLSLIIAYGSFLIGQQLLNVSGVITVLMAAIVFIRTWNGRRRSSDSARKTNNDNHSIKTVEAFWNYITDIVNGLIFFALGAATGNHNFEDTPSIGVVVAVIALFAARFVIVYGGSGILRLAKQRFPIAWQHILFLGGLRGNISALLILLIPHDYPYRGYFLCLAFAMIAFSLIVQPALVKVYLNRAKLSE